jgi:hypothetical protein
METGSKRRETMNKHQKDYEGGSRFFDIIRTAKHVNDKRKEIEAESSKFFNEQEELLKQELSK